MRKKRKKRFAPLPASLSLAVIFLLCIQNYSMLAFASESGWKQDHTAINSQSGNTIDINQYLIAHKGYSHEAPENTLAAFRLAGEYGFRSVECDIRQTADGVWVIMHNKTIDKTTNGSGYVENITFEELLQYTVDAGNGLAEFPNEKVPTLEEYLDICREYGMCPVIEVKSSEQPFRPESLAAILNPREEKSRMTVISFSGKILLSLRQYMPDTKMFLVKDGSLTHDDIDFCVKNGIDGIDVRRDTSEEMINDIHAAGLSTMAWTVDSKKKAEYLCSLGVIGITTNSLLPFSQEEETPTASAPAEGEVTSAPAGDEVPPAPADSEASPASTDDKVLPAPAEDKVPSASMENPTAGNTDPGPDVQAKMKKDSRRSLLLGWLMKLIGEIVEP